MNNSKLDVQQKCIDRDYENEINDVAKWADIRRRRKI
jgi:hypothetical protein